MLLDELCKIEEDRCNNTEKINKSPESDYTPKLMETKVVIPDAQPFYTKVEREIQDLFLDNRGLLDYKKLRGLNCNYGNK